MQRSSAASGANRPWPDQHYESMQVEAGLLEETRLLVLVDDVVTRGATFLGAASRLHDAYPQAELRGFAVVRTKKPDETLVAITDPRVGEITWRPGWINRSP